VNILICPDSFKGSISSGEFCLLANEVLHLRYPEANIVMKPLADGGENTLECIFPHLWNAEIIWVETIDPLQRPIKASYISFQHTAFIEMASSSGLTLIEPQSIDIMHSTTYGTGILIKHALDSGKKKIVLFAGGSATNDGGVGIAAALGIQFYDYEGVPIQPSPFNLHTIEDIETNHQYSDIEFVVATDVKNPLLGEEGASYVYGPQKGATEKTLPLLEEGLRYYAALIETICGSDLTTAEGIGAAGGTPLSMVGLFNAKMVSAVDLIFDIVEFKSDFDEADIVITGEGKFDGQSLSGKIVGRIILDCIKSKKKCYIIAGIRSMSIIYKNIMHFDLKPANMTIHEAIINTNENLRKVLESLPLIPSNTEK
jgi:glycerate 2-kinase